MSKTIKFVTLAEVEQLYFRFINFKSYAGYRNALLLWLSFHHGLRANELLSLKWDNFTLSTEGVYTNIYIQRLKDGNSGLHELDSRENNDLIRFKNILLKRNLYASNGFIFLSETSSTPYAAMHSNTWRKSLREESAELWGEERAKDITPHSLRHGCGFYLASKGIDTERIKNYLGHKNIESTLIYTSQSTQKIIGFDFM